MTLFDIPHTPDKNAAQVQAFRKYKNLNKTVSNNDREVVNNYFLREIENPQELKFTKELIYNSYTGVGGLHGLEFSDFESFHTYTNAKKEIENGQFFTPIAIAEKMAAFTQLKPYETIADITFGSGVFINFFPEDKFYGCEIDSKAYKIANYLFPDANLTRGDMRYYTPEILFDYIIGNPPFNLLWREKSKLIYSQDYYFNKSAELLRPGGLIMAIVPQSFCKDEMFNKSAIENLNRNFNFVFQILLENDTFKNLGVTNFPTKILCLQRKGASIPEQQYINSFVSWEEAQGIYTKKVEINRQYRFKGNYESKNGTYEFKDKVKKYLYEIKTQKALHQYQEKAIAYTDKFFNQKCPDGVSFDDWIKSPSYITEKQVLSYLKRTVKKQSRKSIDKIAIVQYKYGFKVKAYSGKMQAKAKEKYKVSCLSFNDAILTRKKELPLKLNASQLKLIDRKRREYKTQQINLSLIDDVNPDITKFLTDFYWISKNKVCQLNDMQKLDIGRILTKNYDILNWQQGSGKTAAAFACSKYRKCKKTFIVSTALAINLTWNNFLKTNYQKFVIITSLADFKKVQNAEYVLISHDYLIKYERQLKKLIKSLSNKISLILDESDEITNHLAKRTKAIKNCFQRAKYKLFTTGTTTRNNISELYPQLELLYNNSVNMLCNCEYVYIENRENNNISKQTNEYEGKPFPPWYGNKLFKRCFNPSTTTVFGITQQNQSIYNELRLKEIISKTIITRKFKDIAGDKYKIVNESVNLSAAERKVYAVIIEEFYSIVNYYFESTGNTRKDALLRIIRQLQLLIKATSTPQFFKEYTSKKAPNKALHLFKKLEKLKAEKVCIGCTTKDAVDWYIGQIKALFPERPLYLINGDVDFKKRQKIIESFEATQNGILVCTQQSLKSSVNIPECDHVIIESLQWNIPKIEQFYFRFIRYDSPRFTTVYFVNYHETIEANLLALLMSKEKLNDYIKTLEYRDNSDIYNEYDIDPNLLNTLITKEKDEKGKIQVRWGQNTFC